MSTNTSIDDDIRAALVIDPRIPDPEQIAISTEAGAATLRGTVGSLGQRRAAVADARAVEGVYDVDDELKVRLMDESRRSDADIRGIALQILMWDVDVPVESVDVKVSDGWVTLSGDVTYQFECDAAYDDVASLVGVFGVTNDITVNTVT